MKRISESYPDRPVVESLTGWLGLRISLLRPERPLMPDSITNLIH